MKKIILTWRIQNYSYCWHERGQMLISPVFRTVSLHGTTWKISVCPKGYKDSNFISCFLHRGKDDDGPPILSLSYEFSAITSSGALSAFTPPGCKEFAKGAVLGSVECVSRDEVLISIQRAHLLQDVLTIICELCADEGDTTEVEKLSARTHIGVERVYEVYSVKEFSALTCDPNNTLRIVSRPEGRPLMSINIFATSGSKFIVEIIPEKRWQLSAFSCNLYLLDATGNRVECGEADTRIKSVTTSVLRVPLLFSKWELWNKMKLYLPNGVLSLHCECAFPSRSEFTEIDLDYYGRHVMEPQLPLVSDENERSPLYAEHVEGPCVQDDLKSLYDDRVLSDIKLKTKTETFSAHKTVLAARSSVLRAMLTNDMKEKSEQCIKVEDLEDDTVRQLLLFLYTDAVEDLTLDTAPKLYYAADKYQVQRLIAKCSTFLIANISVSNVSEILLLADMHQDSHLKTAVEDFILKHDGEVFISEAWMTFMETQPQLALKTMHLKYRK